MKNESNHGKNILKNKNNDWSVLNLFASYVKRNRSLIISIFLLPLIFIGLVVSNTRLWNGTGLISGDVILIMIWLTQTASFALQNFLTILLDLKQTIIYRRIGLTRISKTKFIFIVTIFNLLILLVSDLFVFTVFIILCSSLHLTALINSIFHWKLLIMIIFMITISITFTSLGLLLSTIIKTRTGQAITSVVTNFLVIIPLMALLVFLNAIATTTNNLINIIGLGGMVAIFMAVFIIINGLSFLFYYLTWKFFKWFD